MSSVDFFDKNHYVIVKDFINKETAVILYNHVINNAKRLAYLRTRPDYIHNEGRWGTFSDSQAFGCFSLYGDPIFDSLLEIGTQKMEVFTGKKLLPTYSYHRLYETNAELVRHKDRPSCEISVTVCLGYNNSNLKDKADENWNWPMFVSKEEGGKGIPIHLTPGDVIIYRGCEVEHWREPFPGLNHAQVFLHYNEKDGKFNNVYDGRPLLGLPYEYRS
jgi:hypothetical protein